MKTSTPWNDGIRAAAAADLAIANAARNVARIRDSLTAEQAADLAALIMECRIPLQSGMVDAVEDPTGVFAKLVKHFAPNGLGKPGLLRNNRLAFIYQWILGRSKR